MFANFAAKRHFNGPLRAVSPVADDYAEIDWKMASKLAKKQSSRAGLPSANSQKLIQYIDQSFKGSMPKESLSFRASFELLCVEAVSLFIPLFYISIVLALWGISVWFFCEPMIGYWHTNDYLHATYWACPAVLCIGFLYVLLRPIFGGFRSYHGRVLLEHEAPALFHLVSTMSRHLNVTPPKRIEVNNETAIRVDAYAGINSIYRDEYKIIIGMPLIMSLSLNELTVMIAHELSHFRSKQKKIAFYLMHHVSEWLYFRATGQDKRYQKLLRRLQKENLSKHEYVELWCWQRVHLFQQWLFMKMYQFHRQLTAWKSRQIEFETDETARKISGDAAFKQMFKAVRAAQYAQRAVSLQNDWAWKDGYLLDDYALAVALETQKISKATLAAVEESYKKSVSYFCPNDFERMSKANGNQAGLLKAAIPAKFLLEQAKKVSKDLTVLDYESNGIKGADQYCVPSEKIRKLKQIRDANLKYAQFYFDGRGEDRIIKFEPSHERDVVQFDIQKSIDYIRSYRVEDRRHQAAAFSLFRRIEKTYILERLKASKLPVYKYVQEDALPKKNAKDYLVNIQEQYAKELKHMEYLDQVFYQRAHEGLTLLDCDTRNKIHSSFHNLELYCQLRELIAEIILASKPLKLIVNGLSGGASARILQAGANEKAHIWGLIQKLRVGLKDRPITASLHGKKVHILTYLDYKLGQLPEHSESFSIMAMAEYSEQLLQLLTFQYSKWQGHIAMVLVDLERKNGIAQVNLLNRH